MKRAIIFIILILLFIMIALLALPKKAILVGQNLKKSLFAQSSLILNSASTNFKNLCLLNAEFSETTDKQFCSKEPIFKAERELEINLELMKGFYYENGLIKKIFPVLSKAPSGKWYQTPTGFFSAGVKKEKHLSSLFPVYMPYSIQYNEDFFIHAVPIYVSTGEKVPSNAESDKSLSAPKNNAENDLSFSAFSGGCIRINDNDAAFLFENIKTEDRIVVYETLNNLKINSNFSSPIDLNKIWVRQSFNNPLRVFWGIAKNAEDKKIEYYHHAGIDLTGWHFENLDVYSIADGKIIKIQKNDKADHGFGNTIIMEFQNPKSKTQNLYALYGHLDSINPEIIAGREVAKGQLIGKSGNSGYGCQNYWRVGEDGCDKTTQQDIHLHFEIKTAPILESPTGKSPDDIENKDVCYNEKRKEYGLCYGYTPDNPEAYGYIDPIKFLGE